MTLTADIIDWTVDADEPGKQIPRFTNWRAEIDLPDARRYTSREVDLRYVADDALAEMHGHPDEPWTYVLQSLMQNVDPDGFGADILAVADRMLKAEGFRASDWRLLNGKWVAELHRLPGPVTDEEVTAVVRQVATSGYKAVSEHVLRVSQRVVDAAVERGFLRVVSKDRAVATPGGGRFLAIA